MPKCPKCNKKIATLTNVVTGYQEYEVTAKDENNKPYKKLGFEPDCGTNDFNCPECLETLFTDDRKALLFLKPLIK